MATEEDKEDFEYRRNPPKFADQGDDSMSDNPFGGSDSNPFGDSSGGSNPFGGGESSNPYADSGFGSGGGFGSGFGGPGSAFGNPNMPGQSPGQDQNKPQTADEKFYSGLGTAAKGTYKGAKNFSQSFAESDASVFAKTGNTAIKLGIGGFVVFVLLLLMSIIYPLHNLVTLLCGSLLTSVVGLVIFGLTYDKAKEEQNEPDDFGNDDEVANDGFFQIEDDDDDDWEDEEEIPDDGIIPMDEDDDWLDEDDEDEVLEPVSVMSVDDAKERLSDLEPGMQSRSHLYERYSMVLPNMTPKYDEWTDYTEEDNYFVDIEMYLREAAEVSMSSSTEEDMPVLTRLRENYFIMQITCDRPSKKFNPQDTATELAKIYAVRVLDEDTDQAYARVSTSGKEVVITIFKGTSDVIVTLRDTYREVDTWVKDPSVRMPVVLGINEVGKVWKTDFSKIYSALISGMPRSGKSWETTLIILQIAMYCSPREVNFYVCDTKDSLSDYQNMNIPHIKEFAGSIDKIMALMKWIVDVEGPRRKKIIGSESDVNYNDYIARNPNKAEEIPRLYFVIDEMMDLTSALSEDKDQKSLFNSYLKTIVSQYPGMGIYFIGIPHRVNNNVIPKDVYALVPCNIAVMAEEADIKNAIGVTKREFPYSLTEPGESALKVTGVNKGRPSYSRGLAIAPSNEENRRIMEFIRAMWSRLDHEYYHGPRQDFQDKKNDVFDNYDCGCVSHGGTGSVSSKKAPAGVKNRTPEALSGNSGPLAGMNGGYTDDDTEEDMFDVTDDWDSEFPLT